MREIKLDRWIPLAEAARLAGEPIWRFRRRLGALNGQSGGRLLRHFGFGTRKRRLHVSAEALLGVLRTDPAAIDGAVSALSARIRDLEIALEAEKKARLAFQSRVYRELGWGKKRHERTRENSLRAGSQ